MTSIVKQIEWDHAHMDAALRYSKLSHCTRYKVGCLIVLDRRPIMMGLNGSAPHKKNCDEVFPNPPQRGEEGYEKYKEGHRVWSIENEHHAETNALNWCARQGISTNGATIYSTLSNCVPCGKSMVFSGIERFVYLEEYDRDLSGLDYLKNNGLYVDQIGNCSLWR